MHIILAIFAIWFIYKMLLAVFVIMPAQQQAEHDAWMINGLKNQREGKPWEAKRE